MFSSSQSAIIVLGGVICAALNIAIALFKSLAAWSISICVASVFEATACAVFIAVF